MICCAERCRNRSCSPSGNNNDSSYLTFGDYSVYASEMKRAYAEDSTTATAPAPKIAHKCPANLAASGSKSNNNHSTINCDVFLGGSCNPTTWRQDTAIPLLNNLGITYYNPQVPSWRPELMELEHQAKSNAEILFFVINSQTRATAAVIEVAYLVSKQRKVIVVVSGLKGPGQKICNEPISQKEYDELTNSQLLLQDLVERHGVPVFNDIHTALHCTAKVIRDSIRPQDLKISDLAQLPKMDHLQNSNLKLWICNNLKKTFDSLDTTHKGEISLSDFHHAFRILMKRELTREEVINVLDGIKKVDKDSSPVNPSSTTIEPSLKKETNGVNGTVMLNFDQFCYIMAELNYHHHHSFNRPNQLANKASYFNVHNISLALTRLLENIPGSKPGWVPLTSAPDPEVSSFPSHDVYLGGPITTKDHWRSDSAIPLLKKHGLTYINPAIRQRNPKLFPTDISEISKCRFIFFYIPESTRSLESCILAVYYIGLGYQVVLCIEHLKNDCQVDGEMLTEAAVKDYNRGRSYVSDMATREGVKVFKDLSEALDCVVDKCSCS